MSKTCESNNFLSHENALSEIALPPFAVSFSKQEQI
jgi:hypothetical protein